MSRGDPTLRDHRHSQARDEGSRAYLKPEQTGTGCYAGTMDLLYSGGSLRLLSAEGVPFCEKDTNLSRPSEPLSKGKKLCPQRKREPVRRSTVHTKKNRKHETDA